MVDRQVADLYYYSRTLLPLLVALEYVNDNGKLLKAAAEVVMGNGEAGSESPRVRRTLSDAGVAALNIWRRMDGEYCRTLIRMDGTWKRRGRTTIPDQIKLEHRKECIIRTTKNGFFPFWNESRPSQKQEQEAKSQAKQRESYRDSMSLARPVEPMEPRPWLDAS